MENNYESFEQGVLDAFNKVNQKDDYGLDLGDDYEDGINFGEHLQSHLFIRKYLEERPDFLGKKEVKYHIPRRGELPRDVLKTLDKLPMVDIDEQFTLHDLTENQKILMILKLQSLLK